MDKDYKKLYEDALERAKYLKENTDSVGALDVSANFEYIFPELKESEDEKIRKGLIKGLSAMRDIHKHQTFSDDAINIDDAIAWLEKQGEQKPTMIQWKGNNLKEVIDFTGVYKEGFEKWFHNSWEEYEKYVHEHNNIFKLFNEDGSHIEVPVGAWIVKTPDGYNTASRYVFRQKPAWSEEDLNKYDFAIRAIGLCKQYAINNQINGYSKLPDTPQRYEELLSWFKSLKDRVRPQPKQEWSEDDIEKMVKKRALSSGTTASEMTFYRQGIEDTIKSLKFKPNHWKPSEEQMAALVIAVHDANGRCYYEKLFSIYNDLKKL